MMMMNQNHGNITSIAIDEVFEPFLQSALCQSFGLSRLPIQLNFCTSSGKQKADRFNLAVPYAGQTLSWTVMFNSTCPEIGPDFDFHNDSFMADPAIDTIENDIPSLAKWEPNNKDSLLKVLTELTLCYKQHQINLLEKQERPSMEFLMLTEDPNIQPDDIEVILLPEGMMPTEARFYIRLRIDFSRLPGRSDNADNDEATLMISFNRPDWSRIVPQLFLTQSLETALGGLQSLHLPNFVKDKLIIDYIPEVTKIINDRITEIVTKYEARVSFVAALVHLQSRNVVEYDAYDFSRISILLENEDFVFLVHFRLPADYPQQPPYVTLQSIYHMSSNEDLVKMQCKNVPHHRDWPPSMAVKKILDKIIERELPLFKNLSLTSMNRR